jgi:hypothetical protein
MSKIAPFVLMILLTACSKKVETRVIFPEGTYFFYDEKPFYWHLSRRDHLGMLEVKESTLDEYDRNGAAAYASFRIKKGRVGGDYYIYFSDMEYRNERPILLSGNWRYDDYDNSVVIDGREKVAIYLQDIDDPYGSTRYILVKQ